MYSVMKSDRYGERILMRCEDGEEAVEYAKRRAVELGFARKGFHWGNADGYEIWIEVAE